MPVTVTQQFALNHPRIARAFATMDYTDGTEIIQGGVMFYRLSAHGQVGLALRASRFSVDGVHGVPALPDPDS